MARPGRGVITAIAMLAGCLMLARPAAAHDFWPPAIERGRYLMGTLCSATVELTDTSRAGPVLERALEAIARLEPVMSSWRTDSELARFHAAADSGFICSPELFDALVAARAWAESTRGAFDPTIEPVNRIWDMRGQGRVPDGRNVFFAFGHQHLGLTLAGVTARIIAAQVTGGDPGMNLTAFRPDRF